MPSPIYHSISSPLPFSNKRRFVHPSELIHRSRVISHCTSIRAHPCPINSPERVFCQGSLLPPALVDGNSIAHVIREHEPVQRGSGPLLWVVHTPTINQLYYLWCTFQSLRKSDFCLWKGSQTSRSPNGWESNANLYTLLGSVRGNVVAVLSPDSSLLIDQ